MTFLGPHAICGRNCRYFHPAPKRFPATVHGDALHTAPFLAQVMWHRDGPTFLTDNVWVGISFDGTKLWQASFVHFAVEDLWSHMPLGSWILLRQSEKKAIISQLAEVYDLNADLTELAQQQIPDKGGYLRKVISFFIADTKAQVILGGCSSFTAKNPAATVCWPCGQNRATILHEFGCGMGVIFEQWLWAGMICPIVRPPQRPPDYGLHGVHRQVHNGFSALVNSLHAHGASVEKGKGREVGAMVPGSHSDPGTDRHRCGVGGGEEGEEEGAPEKRADGSCRVGEE